MTISGTRFSRLFFPCVSALLLALSYLFLPFSAYIVFAGFLPFFLYIEGRDEAYSRIFITCFLAGVIFFGITLYWLFMTLPLDWAGIESWMTSLAIFLPIWAIIIAGFGIWWGMFGWMAALLLRSSLPVWVKIILLASLWTLVEYTRSFVFGLIWISPGQSAIGPDWTYSDLSYLLANTPFGFLARLGGMYFVDFFIMLANASLFFVVKSASTRQRILFVCIFTSVLAVLGIVFQGLENQARKGVRGTPVTVAAVSIHFPKRFYFSPLEQDKKREVISNLLRGDTILSDIIVLPEIAEFIDPALYSDTQLMNRLKEGNSLVVDHQFGVKSEEQSTPESYYWRADKGLVSRQGKELLMPGGEYLPWLVVKGLKFFGKEYVVEAYNRTRTVYKGEKASAISDPVLGGMSSLLCSEVMSSRIARRSVAEGARVLFLQTSDAIFRGDKQYLVQMVAMAQMRALETGRYIVRAANAGYSATIDPFGDITAIVPKGEGILHGSIMLVDNGTPYVRWGDWIVLVSILSLASVGTYVFFKKSSVDK